MTQPRVRHPVPPMSRWLRVGLMLATLLSLTAVVLVIVVVLSPALLVSRFVHPHGAAETDAIRVTEGQTFIVDGQRIDAGWSIRRSGTTLQPVGVTFTSEDDSLVAETETLSVSFVGEKGRAIALCESDDSVEPGSPNSFSCDRVEAPAGGYDHLEVTAGHGAGF